MLVSDVRLAHERSLSPGDRRVEAFFQIPDGFTPEMVGIDHLGAALPIIKAMHCSLVVSVRFDDAPHVRFSGPFGHLPERLSPSEAKSLTVLVERHDGPGTRERERRVEHDETWRMRVWISGTQECADEVPPQPTTIEEALDRYAEAVRNTQSVLDEPHSNAERHTAKVTAEQAIEEKARDAVMAAISRLALGAS